MLLGMFLFFLVIFLGVITHKNRRFEQKVYKNIPVYDWMLISVFPLTCYIVTATFVYSIILRDRINLLPLRDFDILVTGILICIYAISGNSIHFTSKVLWRYLDKKTDHRAYEVNELFHGKFSHLLIFVGVLLIIFCIALLEINHPMPQPIDGLSKLTVMLMSIGTGLAVAKMITKSRSDDLTWRVNRPIFFSGCFIFAIHLLIIAQYKLNMMAYPFNTYTLLFLLTFIISFILRKIFRKYIYA